jgi:hypothetical protein
MPCSVPDCERPSQARNLCSLHYNKARREKTLPALTESAKGCHVLGCSGAFYAKGFCAEHYGQWRKHGDPLCRKRHRRGAGYTSPLGYKYVTVNGKVVLEHRHILEEHLERPLRSDEVVRHLNGDRSDNRLENLSIGHKDRKGRRSVIVDGRYRFEHRHIMEQHLGR